MWEYIVFDGTEKKIDFQKYYGHALKQFCPQNAAVVMPFQTLYREDLTILGFKKIKINSNPRSICLFA